MPGYSTPSPRRRTIVTATFPAGAGGRRGSDPGRGGGATLNRGGEGRAEWRYSGRVYRVGDKVTQMRNNYDLEVFNGAVGLVSRLSVEDQQLFVRMEGREDEVVYDFGDLDELAHAFAVTIHRSQGSEYPCVVIPLTTSAWMMLQRNLLYTAVTRAKQIVVLVGSRRAAGPGGAYAGRWAALHGAGGTAAAGWPGPGVVGTRHHGAVAGVG